MNNTSTSLPDLELILLAAVAILVTAHFIFRRRVRDEYLQHGRLSFITTSLQLLVFGGIMSFPYLFLPANWPWSWQYILGQGSERRLIGLMVISVGMLTSFATMFWFGLPRAFGISVVGLVRRGPYYYSRNPQVLGGYLMIIGVSIQWPSWFSLLWLTLYALTCHWMILSEEEHLENIFGEDYLSYCAQTPRYLLK